MTQRLLIFLCAISFSFLVVKAENKSFDLMEALSKVKNEYLVKDIDISIRNNYSTAILLKIFHNSVHLQDLYLTSYQESVLKKVPEGLYSIEVFDTSGKRLGYLEEEYNEKNHSSKPDISISRFSVKPSIDRDLRYPNPDEVSTNNIVKELRKSIDKKEMEDIAKDIFMGDREIKVANISDYIVHLSLERNGKAIADWTLNNDVYSPQTLETNGAAITISTNDVFALKAYSINDGVNEVLECLDKTECETEAIKKENFNVKDLKLDDEKSYIWIIDELPSTEP